MNSAYDVPYKHESLQLPDAQILQALGTSELPQ